MDYATLRATFQSDEQMAKAMFAGTVRAMGAMREACIDAMIQNPDDKKAISTMRALDPVDVLVAAR